MPHIGGSIRSPAANQGLYGFRPTTFRIPKTGVLAPHPGSGYVYGVVGPLNTSFQGVKLFMKTVLDYKPCIQDQTLLPLPWRDEPFHVELREDKKLKIGVLWTNAIVKPHPPIGRALEKITQALSKVENIEIVEWKPYKHDMAWEIIVSPSTGNQPDWTETCKGQSILSRRRNRDNRDHRSIQRALAALSSFILTDNPHNKPRTTSDILRSKDAMEKYRQEYASSLSPHSGKLRVRSHH